MKARLNTGSVWPAAAIPRTSSAADDGPEAPAVAAGVAGCSIAGAALGLTGVPGLAPVSAPGVGAGLGVTGVTVAGAALGLTGDPGFAAVSPPVVWVLVSLWGSLRGNALGLLIFDCAIRLHVSKSACVGSAASATVELTRKTLGTRTMRALILFIPVSSSCLTSNQCAGRRGLEVALRKSEGPYRNRWPVQFTPELF